MHFKTLFGSLALVGLAASSPIESRNNDGSGSGASSSSGSSSGSNIDGVILNYALTLEHLEAAFYRLGLQMYNAGAFAGAGFPDWVRFRFSEIAFQEATHVSTLTAGLQAAGITPVKACTYDFGITSPQSYLALAQVLEGVGVAAYLGAAPLVTSKTYLAIAGSILVVEARHETWVNSGASNKDPSPRSFAAPLNFNQVYTLAAPFIKSCPSGNPTLPVKSFPSVTVNTAGPYKTGQTIQITVPTSLSGTLYAAFVDALATEYQQITPQNGKASVKIPAYATGQNYLIITNQKAVSDAATVAGPAIVPVDVQATLFPY